MKIFNKQKILYYILFNFAIGVSVFLGVFYAKKYSDTYAQNKYEKCVKYVYTLMEDNIILDEQLSQLKVRELEYCNKKIADILLNQNSNCIQECEK